jgi:hypothetical protein
MPTYTGVYKKGKKWYGAKWWKGKTYVTKLCKTAEEAAHLREKLIKRLRKGFNVEKSNITVANFIELYLENYITKRPNVHKMTIDSIKSGFKTSNVPIIGHLKLKDLNPEIMQKLQNKLLEKYAPGTVKVRINDFKRVLRRAVIWHYLPYDPSIDLDSVIVDYDTEKPDILSPEQFKLIFQSN